MSASDDINRFVKKLKRDIKAGISARNMTILAQMAIVLIQNRTRSGKGVEKVGGPEVRLKKLSNLYIEARKKMKLSPFTTPSKSNLTRSGRMLASLRPVKTSNGRVTISPTGSSREGVSNALIAQFVDEGGRPFLYLSANELKKIALFYQDNILKID